MSHEIRAICFQFPISWYSFTSSLRYSLLQIFRCWLAFSFPCCQDFCHSNLMNFWIVGQCADFRCFDPGHDMVLRAACLAPLSTLSFPAIPWRSRIHPMLSENCGFHLMIEYIISSMHFTIAWPDWQLLCWLPDYLRRWSNVPSGLAWPWLWPYVSLPMTWVFFLRVRTEGIKFR